MIKCFCGSNLGIMAEIMAVQPEDFIEPEKSKGTFEVLPERMNDFERAAYTVMRRYETAADDKIRLLKSGEVKNNEKKLLETEAEALKDMRETISNLMYFSIQNRLNRWGSQIGVSSGFKIVVLEPEEETETRVGRKIIKISLPAGLVTGEVLSEILSKVIKDISRDDVKQGINEKVWDDGKPIIH